MRSAVHSFNDAVYKIYEAALSAQHWIAALEEIAALSGSTGSLITARGAEDWQMILNAPALDPVIAAGWHTHNIWLDRLNESAYRVGDVYRDQDVATPEELASDPLYVEFLPSVGLGWNMAAILQSDFGAPTGLLVQRAHEKGPYRQDEMDMLQLLARHVEQSLRISGRLVGEESAQDTLTQTLDALDRATFILDAEQRSLHLNRQALGLMGRYFNEEDGRLVPVVPTQHAAFAAAVEAALVSEGSHREPPQPVILTSAEGDHPLVLWVLPLVGASAEKLAPQPAAQRVLVLAQALRTEKNIDPAVIRSVFGLTHGEARLAALMGAGHSLHDSAGQLGITEGTARVVLKRIFQKMDLHRQSELVDILSIFGGTGHRSGQG